MRLFLMQRSLLIIGISWVWFLTGAAWGQSRTGGNLDAQARASVEALGKRLIEGIHAASAEDRKRIVGEIYAAAALAKPGPERICGQLADLQRRYPGLEFHRAELSEWVRETSVSRVLHVYAKAVGDKLWRDFQVRVESDPPHKLTELVFIAEVTEPVYLPNGDITDPATLAWLNGYIDRLVAEYDLAGSVLIAEGDRPVLERYFGYADAARRVKVDATTRFNLGSGNKMFTALAAAQLVDAGKLGWEATLDQFIPDFPDATFARQVALAHLLSHTAGIAEFWTDATRVEKDRARTITEMLPLIFKAGTRFSPGTKCEYSNSNFVLAGLMVERAAGRDYYELVREGITGRLALADTEFYAMDGSADRLADALRRADQGWAPAARGYRGGPAGGGFSTVRDMLKFSRGLMAGKIVSKDMLARLTAMRTKDLPDCDLDYGLGFMLYRQGGVDGFGHGGIAPGVNFELRIFPKRELTLVMFCNQDNGAYDDLRKSIVKLITGER